MIQSQSNGKRHQSGAMIKHAYSTAALLSAVLFAMQPAGSLAATQIGVAASIKPNAERGTGTKMETLSPGSQLFANETVRTGNLGQADLVFVDKTNLTVGPASEVRLDKFVYDPNGRSGQVVMQMSKGAFRFVTGSQDHRAYQVNTPYGTLGVRGTVVEMIVQGGRRRDRADKCDAKIRLVEGRATYRTTSGKIAELTEPNQVICVSEVGDVSRSTSSESILTFEVGDVGGGVGGGPPPPVVVPPPGGGNNGPPPCPDTCAVPPPAQQQTTTPNN